MARAVLALWAEKKARMIRRELGLRADEPIDPFFLAAHLGILVIYPTEVKDLSTLALRQLLMEDPYSWSGASLPLPSGRFVVILNSGHSPLRNVSTLMEELCHILLGHRPSQLIQDDDGVVFRTCDPDLEREAQFLAAALLVPYRSLRAMVEASRSVEEIAAHFRVSQELVKFRLKVNGLWKRYTGYAGPTI